MTLLADGAAQRAGAVGGRVALRDHGVLERGGEGERELGLSRAALHYLVDHEGGDLVGVRVRVRVEVRVRVRVRVSIMSDGDLLDLGPREAGEDDDLVEAVEELRLEAVAWLG